MKKFHQITQIALLIFFVAYLVFFIAFNTLGGIFGMDEVTSDSMVKIMLGGLFIFLITWLAGTMTLSKMTKQLAKKEAEMHELKSKLYDLEHPSPANPKKQNIPDSKVNPESDESGIKPRQNYTD